MFSLAPFASFCIILAKNCSFATGELSFCIGLMLCLRGVEILPNLKF